MQDLHKWKEVSPILALGGVLVMIFHLSNNAPLFESLTAVCNLMHLIG